MATHFRVGIKKIAPTYLKALKTAKQHEYRNSFVSQFALDTPRGKYSFSYSSGYYFITYDRNITFIIF